VTSCSFIINPPPTVSDPLSNVTVVVFVRPRFHCKVHRKLPCLDGASHCVQIALDIPPGGGWHNTKFLQFLLILYYTIVILYYARYWYMIDFQRFITRITDWCVLIKMYFSLFFLRLHIIFSYSSAVTYLSGKSEVTFFLNFNLK